jgi:hypothetical protein
LSEVSQSRSGAINNINDRLHEEIDRTVEEVIRMYEGLY